MAERPLFTLSPRLACIAGFIPDGARLADVGSDHAYLPIHLLREGKIAHAIASDISQPCVVRARANALRYRVPASQLDVRLSDGLRGIAPDEVDTIVIAGMGGETISDILTAAPWTHDGKLLILHPASKGPVLRQWCMDNGFGIVDEQLVQEGHRIYPILVVRGDAPVRREHRFTIASAPVWERSDAVTLEYLRRQRLYLSRELDHQAENADIIAVLDERLGNHDRTDNL